MQEQIIENLIEQFRTLPGVGYKTAQRFAYSIIEGKNERAERFANAIKEAKRYINNPKNGKSLTLENFILNNK